MPADEYAKKLITDLKCIKGWLKDQGFHIGEFHPCQISQSRHVLGMDGDAAVHGPVEAQQRVVAHSPSSGLNQAHGDCT